MHPWELLGQTRTPAGDEMALTRRSGEYVILASGKSLMSSRMHGSEQALAALAGHLVQQPAVGAEPPVAQAHLDHGGRLDLDAPDGQVVRVGPPDGDPRPGLADGRA